MGGEAPVRWFWSLCRLSRGMGRLTGRRREQGRGRERNDKDISCSANSFFGKKNKPEKGARLDFYPSNA